MASRRVRARGGEARPPAPPGRWSCARDRSAAPGEGRSVAAQHAVPGELEAPGRAEAASRAEDPAVRGLLRDERVLDAIALAPLVHADAVRDDLEQPSVRAAPIRVRAKAWGAAIPQEPARV